MFKLIEQWATDRNLHTADPNKQMLKLMEETGELASAMARSNDALTKDAVGDIVVVLTVLCTQLNISVEECIRIAYDEIKDRKGKMINDVFIKEADL